MSGDWEKGHFTKIDIDLRLILLSEIILSIGDGERERRDRLAARLRKVVLSTNNH